jgi:putative flippase GtrA
VTQSSPLSAERFTAVRFAINGVVATAAHYMILVTLIEVARVPSVGLANGLASVVGITVSYLGNRWFVFGSSAPHRTTLPRFIAVYAAVALLNVAVLYCWSDLLGLDYSLGFLIAISGSVVLTYIGNKLCVFARTPQFGNIAESNSVEQAPRGRI